MFTSRAKDVARKRIKDEVFYLFAIISVILTVAFVYVAIVNSKSIPTLKDVVMFILGTISALLVPKKEKNEE